MSMEAGVPERSKGQGLGPCAVRASWVQIPPPAPTHQRFFRATEKTCYPMMRYDPKAKAIEHEKESEEMYVFVSKAHC